MGISSLETLVNSLIEHGYLLLFLWIFLDQVGLPLPAVPAVLAAGALAGQGHLDPLMCALVVVFACLPANLIWYGLGIRFGNKVLSLLCLISIEPDTCISSTTSAFHRYGSASLVFAKFIPGLNIVTPPLAGLLGVNFWRFVLLNGLGSLLYGLVFLVPAYFAHEFLAEITRAVVSYGGYSGAAFGLAMVVWLGWKIAQRRAYTRQLQGVRVEPMHLLKNLDGNASMQVADLRQRVEFNAFPRTIPGAIRVPLDIFDEEIEKLDRNRSLVLFCTCPNEISSARIALKLRKAGFQHAVPLLGGLEKWIELDLPLEERPREELPIR